MRKKSCISFIAIIILLFAVSVNAQLKTPPRIEWQRSLGGSDGEWARSAQQTRDGGYIIAGDANSLDGDVNKINLDNDYWVVKLSSWGMTEWKSLYGGNGGERAYSIRGAKDGSYIIAGYSSSNYWVLNIIDSGRLNWERSLGGGNTEWAASAIPTFDSGYIVVGYSLSNDGMVIDNHGGSDYWVVKLTSNGLPEWSKSYGGKLEDKGTSIQQTSDSGYIVAGFSFSNDESVAGHHGSSNFDDFWIIKLSREGNIEWQRSLGGSEGDRAYDIRQTTDGGYIVVGCSASIDGDVNGHFTGDDMWVVKLTDSGSIEWDRSLGGTKSDVAYSVCQTSDDGYVVAGYTGSSDGNVSFNHGQNDYWLVKLTSTGILEWERSYGGSNYDFALSVQQTTDGGFIVAGNSFSNDGDVEGNHGGSDYWIVKLSPENPSSVEDESATIPHVSITPNPASTSATLTLESNEDGICEVQIISVTGVTLKQYSTRLVAGKQEIVLRDLESLPSGMYEVLVKRNGVVAQRTKLIIE
jgi:hypothetical protein